MNDKYKSFCSTNPNWLFKEIFVERFHKFSSSDGELEEGHDALNLCQAEEEFREERANLQLHVQDEAQVDALQ